LSHSPTCKNHYAAQRSPDVDDAIYLRPSEMPILPWTEQLAIDLGSAWVHIVAKGEGVVLREPSFVAFEDRRHKPVAVGVEARRLWERGVDELEIVRPVQGGVVADFDAAVAMLRQFIRRALGHRPLLSPLVVVATPAGATQVEERALHNALIAAGAGHIVNVQRPLAVGLGSGLPMQSDDSYLLVDIGAGCTDVGVFHHGLVTSIRSFRFGGDDLDEAIIRTVKRQRGIRIGYPGAESLKREAGSVETALHNGPVHVDDVVMVENEQHVESYEIEVDEVPQILTKAFAQLISELNWLIEELPRAQKQQVAGGGIVLSGGTALLEGLDQLLGSSLHLPCIVATDPISCTILGLEAVLSDIEALSLGGQRFGAVRV